MFRFQRDTRFSHDKTPYKTHFSAGIAPGDKRRPSEGGGPTYYFHIDGNGTLHSAPANTCRRRRA
jgi:uncharacterized protein (DUF2461 family)